MRYATVDFAPARGGCDLNTVAGCESAIERAITLGDREVLRAALRKLAALRAGGAGSARSAGGGVGRLAGLASAIADVRRTLSQIDQQKIADVLNGPAPARRRAPAMDSEDELDAHFADPLDRYFGE
jgi:hypothetical protein